ALHRRDAVGDEPRLRHQAGAEAALLHAVGGTADIEVDLVIPEARGDARTLGERRGIRTAELDRHRMLGGVIAEQPLAVAVQYRAGREHLRVDERAPRQQTVEVPAMPV